MAEMLNVGLPAWSGTGAAFLGGAPARCCCCCVLAWEQLLPTDSTPVCKPRLLLPQGPPYRYRCPRPQVIWWSTVMATTVLAVEFAYVVRYPLEGREMAVVVQEG